MTRGRKTRKKEITKLQDSYKKVRPENTRVRDHEVLLSVEKHTSMNTVFRNEELQDLRVLLEQKDLGEEHMLLGAVVLGKFDVVKQLIKDGFPINSAGNNGEHTPLTWAVKDKKLEMIELLIRRGADINLPDKNGNNALMIAAQSANWDQDSFLDLWRSVKDLLSDINHANKIGTTLLHCCVKRQWGSSVDALIDGGANVDCANGKGATPLMMAGGGGHCDMVKSLLRANADIAREDKRGCTALCYAISFMILKKLDSPNPSLQQIVTAINKTNSKLTLEAYIKRRLEMMVDPPEGHDKRFAQTITSVLVHVVTFFMRFIQAGLDMLLEQNTFTRVKEAIERHIDDVEYTTAMLGVLLELVRYCKCCVGNIKQEQLVDEFIEAGLATTCLKVLKRFPMSSNNDLMIATLMPLFLTCSAEGYLARNWLQSNYSAISPYYENFLRNSVVSFHLFVDDYHLRLLKKAVKEFQILMQQVMNGGHVTVPKEKAVPTRKMRLQELQRKNRKEKEKLEKLRKTFHFPNDKITANDFIKDKKGRLFRSSSKLSNFFGVPVQHELPDNGTIVWPTSSRDKLPSHKRVSTNNSEGSDIEEEIRLSKKHMKLKKSRSNIILSDMDILLNVSIDDDEETKSEVNEIGTYWTVSKSELENNELENNIEYTNTDKSKRQNVKGIRDEFREGYDLFIVSDESEQSSDDGRMWEDDFIEVGGGDRNQNETCKTEIQPAVSNEELESTLSYLEHLFRCVASHYEEIWKHELEEGYQDANADCDDLSRLMMTCPQLDAYYLGIIEEKWNSLRQHIRLQAALNRKTYDAAVTKLQMLFLSYDLKSFNENIAGCDQVDDLNQTSEADEMLTDKDKEFYEFTDACVKHIRSCLNKDSKKGFKILCKDVSENSVDIVDSFSEGECSITADDTEQTSSDSSESKELLTTCNAGISPLQNTTIWGDPLDMEMSSMPSEPTVQPNHTDAEVNSPVSSLVTVQPSQSNMCVYQGEKSPFDVDVSSSVFSAHPSRSDGNVSSTEKTSLKSKTSLPALLEMNLSPPPGFKKDALVKYKQLTNRQGLYSCRQYTNLIHMLHAMRPQQCVQLNVTDVRLPPPHMAAQFNIGAGGNFGEVLLGLNAQGCPVAVKHFTRVNLPSSIMIAETLERVLGSLVALSHDHILPYDLSTKVDATLFFVMPLCESNLGQYLVHLKNTDTLGSHVLVLCQQILLGLNYLHSQKDPVVHANLKPSNTLIDANGNIRLSDFGFKSVLYQQVFPPNSSIIWWARETYLSYCSNFQVKCTPASDIQSAGMLLFYVITGGSHPFGEALQAIIRNIGLGILTPTNLEINASDLVTWMLLFEPTSRPTVHDALKHVFFWDSTKRWNYLLACCGFSPRLELLSFNISHFADSVDDMAVREQAIGKWVSIITSRFPTALDNYQYRDTPSGLLEFIRMCIESNKNRKQEELRQFFLNLFPTFTLSITRLLEKTKWSQHPDFKHFFELPA